MLERPMFIMLVYFAMLGSVTVFAQDQPPLQAEWDKIELGMTRDEVIKIMGRPPAADVRAEERFTFAYSIGSDIRIKGDLWRLHKRQLWVQFDANNKATGKGLTGDDTVESLEGKWGLKKVEYDGKAVKETEIAGWTVQFSKNKFVLKETDGTESQDEFVLRPETNPKGIDLHMLSGINKGKLSKGIYELNGNRLRLCIRRPGMERPDMFDSKAETTLMYLERERER